MKKVILTICLMLTLLVSGCTQTFPMQTIKEQQVPAYLTNPNLTKLQRLHQLVQSGLAEGVFHSVNVEYNEVRMDSGLWSFLPIERKQTFVNCFSQYFDLKGSTSRVTIRSKYSDEKLASYSVWTGIKIYK